VTTLNPHYTFHLTIIKKHREQRTEQGIYNAKIQISSQTFFHMELLRLKVTTYGYIWNIL